MHTENSIVIKGTIEEVFQVMTNVEGWSQLLSSHRRMNIIKQEGQMIVIERKGLIKWKSTLFIDKEKKVLESHQIKGPLRGLSATWKFEECHQGTKMILLHDFTCKIPVIKSLIESITAIILRKISTNTLNAVKEKVETKKI